MLRDYELMYIVRADLDEDGLAAANQQVAALIGAQGGEVARTTSWGRRRLAYDIEKMRDGHYMLLELRLDGGRVRELERQLHISDTVFRHMLTVLVPSQPEAEGGEAERRAGSGSERRSRDADGREPAAVAPGGAVGDNPEAAAGDAGEAAPPEARGDAGAGTETAPAGGEEDA